MPLGVRPHARPDSISKRAPSTTRTSLHFRINDLRAVEYYIITRRPRLRGSRGARPAAMACESVAWTTVLAIRAAYRSRVRRRIAERPRSEEQRKRTGMTKRRRAAELQVELGEQVLDGSITFACAILQSHAIENVYATVRIADDAFLLQRAGHHADGLS